MKIESFSDDTCDLCIDPTKTTGLDTKANIYKALKWRTEDQTLVFMGKKIDDDRMLCDYGIHEMSSIVLMTLKDAIKDTHEGLKKKYKLYDPEHIKKFKSVLSGMLTDESEDPVASDLLGDDFVGRVIVDGDVESIRNINLIPIASPPEHIEPDDKSSIREIFGHPSGLDFSEDDLKNISILTDMGFARNHCERMYINSGKNVQEATEMLIAMQFD
jgi:hypothetical protein